MDSKRFQINGQDWKDWLKNALIFVIPDFIVFLGALSIKFSAEGSLVVVLALNLIIDLLRKFVSGK
jgi:hypothetical protein